mmetsp:Transcript_97785/g.198593  ORF Transcript_97785/g.198593 Transcript_97785/m.198593 type:complete len:204 (+) Transcript_97785:638-1249(+)
MNIELHQFLVGCTRTRRVGSGSGCHASPTAHKFTGAEACKQYHGRTRRFRIITTVTSVSQQQLRSVRIATIPVLWSDVPRQYLSVFQPFVGVGHSTRRAVWIRHVYKEGKAVSEGHESGSRVVIQGGVGGQAIPDQEVGALLLRFAHRLAGKSFPRCFPSLFWCNSHPIGRHPHDPTRIRVRSTALLRDRHRCRFWFALEPIL